MYIRKSVRRHGDRTYLSYTLVESVSTPKGPRQRTLCSLGDLRPRSRAEWLRLAHKVASALAGEEELFEDADAEVAAIAERVRSRSRAEASPLAKGVIALDPEKVASERLREAGPVHVGYQFWQRLELDTILQAVGLDDRARRLACAMTLARLIAPSSERAMPAWMRRVAIGDILGVGVGRLAEDALYRMLDTLHPKRQPIEQALAQRERELFGLSGTIVLYDLTSTYFEGQAAANPKAMRGYSRDHRGDCKQVVVGLVLSPEGFPLAHEVFKGSMQDRLSLGEMLDVLEGRVGPIAGQTIVVDRGMAYEDNLATIRARGLHYLVASRQPERLAWLEEFEEDEGFAEVIRPTSPSNPAQDKPHVWVKRQDTADGAVILCRGAGRVAKDRAIREKQEGRFLADVARLTRRIATGTLVQQAKVGEGIGRLKERYPRVARYWKLGFDPPSRQLSCVMDEARRAKAEQLDGCYLLKTDRTDLTAEEAWKLYIMLTRVEDAFRDMKGPLAERPIFHHLERRVDTHIFLCVLAYHLLVAIETTLERRGVHTSWHTIREALKSHQILTTVLPTTDGSVLRIRKASKPERHQREIYRCLGVPSEIIRPRHTWSHPRTTPA
jgi:hypothetical protein